MGSLARSGAWVQLGFAGGTAVGFIPDNDNLAFGFLDPSLVIRGCHLIPCFSNGRTAALLRQGASVARRPSEDDDWCSFYVNM